MPNTTPKTAHTEDQTSYLVSAILSRAQGTLD